MTAPLVPPDTDLRDFHFMPLDVVRLVDSDLTAIASGDEFKAAILLWCKSWHQVPCSSLPNDDRMLAHLAGYGRDLKAWRKVKDVAMRGFVLCDDGRFYHPVIAEKAIEAAASKAEHVSERKGDQERKRREREERSQMFAVLKDAGVVAKWNTSTRDLRQMVTDLSQSATVTGHAPVTPSVTARTGTQTGTGKIDGIGTRARDPGEALELALRKAAGWENHPAPRLAVTGPITALLENGADLDLDVLPVIRALAPRVRSPGWPYFVNAIAQARDDRIAAGTVVSPPTAMNGASHATPRSKPSRDETFAAIDRRIDELEHRRAISGAAAHGQGGPEDPAEGAA